MSEPEKIGDWSIDPYGVAERERRITDSDCIEIMELEDGPHLFVEISYREAATSIPLALIDRLREIYKEEKERDR